MRNKFLNVNMIRVMLMSVVTAMALQNCGSREVTIHHRDLVLHFNHAMHSKISSVNPKAKQLMNGFTPSEYIDLSAGPVKDFELADSKTNPLQDSIGTGTEWTLRGGYEKGHVKIQKIVTIKLYDQFPDEAFFKIRYVNQSERTIEVLGWTNNHYQISPATSSIPFWSFQGESTSARRDWILPLKAGFYQKNFMGMNNTDYGGGIPIVDLWRPDAGISVGHSEVIQRLVSLPVRVDRFDSTASISVQYEYQPEMLLASGDTLETIETFVNVHQGDFYNGLKRYGDVLRSKGVEFAKAQPEAFEASWCAWGYMRDFTVDEILGTIPKLKALGIKWVTIDDGYQQAEGDWHVNASKFPRGDKQMKELVDKLHANGFKVMLWWAPLAADPASRLLTANPDLKLLSEDSAPRYITWWDSYYLSPVYEKTQQHTREMLDLFFNQWGIDGLKMDGQHLNAVPPDFNSLHPMAYPAKACEQLPEFYNMIYREATRIKPNAILQICPCGTCMSVFNMPYMNQAVASDPLNSWQIRLKGKTYKALIAETAYFGDHVELSDGRSDFASSFGVGAVPGTKFTWPKENPSVTEDNLLTVDKEKVWMKWLNLYRVKMLSKGSYLGGLYDMGYDKPETHVIAKGDTLHYAFYSNEWNGVIELKGLEAGKYRVRDYVNNIELGEVTKENPKMKFNFKNSLLVEVYPVK
jgi:alpha-galactosidase